MKPGKTFFRNLCTAAGSLLIFLLILSVSAFDFLRDGGGFLSGLMITGTGAPASEENWIDEPASTPDPVLERTAFVETFYADVTNTAESFRLTNVPTETPTPTATQTPLPTFDETAFAEAFYADVTSTAYAYLLLQTPTVTPIIPDADLYTGLRTVNPTDGQELYYVRTDKSNRRPGFWIGWTEVSNEAYSRCVAAGACSEPISFSCAEQKDYYHLSEFRNYPVVNVTHKQAENYCKWAGMELASLEEWKAAVSAFPAESGNYDRIEAMPRGNGFANLIGNVWEWTAEKRDSAFWIIAGGSWKTSLQDIRLGRNGELRTAQYAEDLGFRCVRHIILN